MNRTIDSISVRTWHGAKARYALTLSGAALAAGLILGGFSLKSSDDVSGATVRPVAVAQPIFANAADAEDAGRAVIANAPSEVQPMFATAADAEYASRSLVDVPELPHPRPVTPMFATEADAEFAARALAQ